jgi:hypothetical protein
MKTIRAEPRKGNVVALIIEVDSTLQEEIVLTAEEGIRLANQILAAFAGYADSFVTGFAAASRSSDKN